VLIDAVTKPLRPVRGLRSPMFAPVFSSGSNSWGQSLNLDGPAPTRAAIRSSTSAIACCGTPLGTAYGWMPCLALVDTSATLCPSRKQMVARGMCSRTHLRRPLT